VIVRILHEGQFEVDGDDLDALNDVDNQIVAALEANDEARFAALMAQMHKLVHERGKEVPVEVIRESDIILPDPDASMDEVRELFTGEGMIPG
jgi:predicted transcriptional regulator